MTPHKVECFTGPNGEPYGRYENSVEFKNGPENDLEWLEMDRVINLNTFPFPSGIIGKTYERDDVEVVWQVWDTILVGSGMRRRFDKGWRDRIGSLKYTQPSENSMLVYKYRAIFNLIPQAVEKEPETVKHAECAHLPLIDTGVGYYHCPACNQGWTYSEWEKLNNQQDLKAIQGANEYAANQGVKCHVCGTMATNLWSPFKYDCLVCEACWNKFLEQNKLSNGV